MINLTLRCSKEENKQIWRLMKRATPPSPTAIGSTANGSSRSKVATSEAIAEHINNAKILDVEREAFAATVAKTAKSQHDSKSLQLETSSSISSTDFAACFELIALTSAEAYKASSKGWSPRDKRIEMKEPAMRYMLVRGEHGNPTHHDPNESDVKRRSCDDDEKNDGIIIAFLSYMLTIEDGYHVVYIYEVHVSPQLQGQGIGALLVQIAEAVGQATGMEKAMLTVFASNVPALRFYRRLGYEEWDAEPVVRKRLRSGTKEVKPTYHIFAKGLREGAAGSS